MIEKQTPIYIVGIHCLCSNSDPYKLFFWGQKHYELLIMPYVTKFMTNSEIAFFFLQWLKGQRKIKLFFGWGQKHNIWTKKRRVFSSKKSIDYAGTGHKYPFLILFSKASLSISFKWKVQLDNFWFHSNLTAFGTE